MLRDEPVEAGAYVGINARSVLPSRTRSRCEGRRPGLGWTEAPHLGQWLCVTARWPDIKNITVRKPDGRHRCWRDFLASRAKCPRESSRRHSFERFRSKSRNWKRKARSQDRIPSWWCHRVPRENKGSYQTANPFPVHGCAPKPSQFRLPNHGHAIVQRWGRRFTSIRSPVQPKDR